MIRIGTSGFSYRDWAGVVYPQKMPSRSWLGYYAGLFSTVELNVTFYRIPSLRSIETWVQTTPDDFLFAVKVFRGITHEFDASGSAPFVTALEPLHAAGKLGAVLLQFANSFEASTIHFGTLQRLAEPLLVYPAAVELRNPQWHTPEWKAKIEAAGLSYCFVDEPRSTRPEPGIVSDRLLAYFRFHGRNPKNWYDYHYHREELESWADFIRANNTGSQLTLVYFNNTLAGQAVEAAQMLKEILPAENERQAGRPE